MIWGADDWSFFQHLQSGYSPISGLHASRRLDFSPAVVNIPWDTVDKIVVKCLGKENMDAWRVELKAQTIKFVDWVKIFENVAGLQFLHHFIPNYGGHDGRRTVNPTRQPWKSNKWYNFYMLMSEDFDATCQHCQDSPIRKELMPCGTPWRGKNAWAMSQISIAIGDQTTESIQNHPKRGITWPLEKISICNTQKPKMINLWHSLGGGTLSCWTSMFTKLFKCRKNRPPEQLAWRHG